MIIMGAGTNHYFHSDTIYRAFLMLTTITGCQGKNGGGWAHYVGQEKVRPVTGHSHLAMSADWSRPPRQMIGTAYWYLATGQYRYDSFGAEAFSSPTGRGRFDGMTTADVLAQSARLGFMPSLPDVQLEPARPRRRGEGQRPDAGRLPRRPARGRHRPLRRRGPGRAGELPAGAHRLAGQPARLLRQGQRVLPAPPARGRARRARRRGRGRAAAARRDLAGGGARGQARPAAGAGLPHDVDDGVRRRRAAGGDLVREARPQHHRHAPVRERLHPGDRAAVADAHRLRHLLRAGPDVQRPGGDPPRRAHRPRRLAARARHPGRDVAAARPRQATGGPTAPAPSRAWTSRS